MPRQKLDLAGQRFGRLTALYPVRKNGKLYWHCKCDCGNDKIVRPADLQSGHTQSCGCLHKELTSKRSLHDLTGKKFGRLTVIKRADRPDKRKRAYWHCKCNCGNYTDVLADNLISGAIVSCGCRQKETGYELRKMLEEKYRKDGVMIPSLKRKRYSNNTSGVKGVWIVNTPAGQRYNAQINVHNQRIWLGQYDNLADAADARKKAEEKYHKPYLDK